MATYVMTGKLTQAAIEGFLAKPEDRRAALAELASAAGGQMKDYYLTTGETDFLMIVEADGPEACATAAMVAGAAGTASDFRTQRAWTTTEFAEIAGKAAKITGSYRKPGD